MKTNLTKKERALLRSHFPRAHYLVLLGLFKHASHFPRTHSREPSLLICDLNWSFTGRPEVRNFIERCSSYLYSQCLDISWAKDEEPPSIPATLFTSLKELELNLIRKQNDHTT